MPVTNTCSFRVAENNQLCTKNICLYRPLTFSEGERWSASPEWWAWQTNDLAFKKHHHLLHIRTWLAAVIPLPDSVIHRRWTIRNIFPQSCDESMFINWQPRTVASLPLPCSYVYHHKVCPLDWKGNSYLWWKTSFSWLQKEHAHTQHFPAVLGQEAHYHTERLTSTLTGCRRLEDGVDHAGMLEVQPQQGASYSIRHKEIQNTIQYTVCTQNCLTTQ